MKQGLIQFTHRQRSRRENEMEIRKPTIILNPGQRVTYSGFAGAVIRHYDGNMYTVRLASGPICVDARDLIKVAA
jgi:hypothetical protein